MLRRDVRDLMILTPTRVDLLSKLVEENSKSWRDVSGIEHHAPHVWSRARGCMHMYVCLRRSLPPAFTIYSKVWSEGRSAGTDHILPLHATAGVLASC